MNEHRRVVVTGIGSVSPAGTSSASLTRALEVGAPCVSDVTTFDSKPFPAHTAGVCSFDPSVYLGKKGLRSFDRGTKLALVAAHLAVEDAALGDTAGAILGVSLGATFGVVSVQGEFDREILSSGPSWVNPATFPFTVYNAQAGSVAIRHAATGPNLTFTSGPVASFDALNAAIDVVRAGEADVMLAGGFEPLSFDAFSHLNLLGVLGSDAQGDERMPYSRRSSGVRFSEGACVLVLEDRDRALARGARILGELTGADSCIADSTATADLGAAIGAVCRSALSAAQLNVKQLSWICAGGSGWKVGDAAEISGLAELCGTDRVPVTSVKAVLGEHTSASGAFQVASALLSFESGVVPALAPGLAFIKAPHLRLNAEPIPRGPVLCTAHGWAGQAGALIVLPPQAAAV